MCVWEWGADDIVALDKSEDIFLKINFLKVSIFSLSVQTKGEDRFESDRLNFGNFLESMVC